LFRVEGSTLGLLRVDGLRMTSNCSSKSQVPSSSKSQVPNEGHIIVFTTPMSEEGTDYVERGNSERKFIVYYNGESES